jgi:hypothetical protein
VRVIIIVKQREREREKELIVVRARAALIARALELLTTDSSLWSFIKKKKKNP